MTNHINERGNLRELFERAVTLCDQGRHPEAVELLGQLLQRELVRGERAAVAGYLAGIYLDHLEQPDQAERLFRQVVLLSPKSELASLGLFHALMALQRPDEALNEAHRYLMVAVSDEYKRLLGEITKGLRDAE